jgi:hypothetical protein
MIWFGVTQPSAQLDHLAGWIFAGSVPLDHRSGCEGVAKIMDARSATRAKVPLWIAQAYPLANLREVILSAIDTDPFAAALHEERNRSCTKQAITFGRVGMQTINDTGGEGKQSLFAELATPDMQYAVIKIQVDGVEPNCLTDT